MKICLVTNEILGATQNGGIATATSHLAILLARHGHAVNLLYTGQPRIDPRSRWNLFYQLAGVEVTALNTNRRNVSRAFMRLPSAVYEHLRLTDFDVILFQDWLALGHGCITAKRCGLGFEKTVLATITHGNTQWLLEANNSFPNSQDHLAYSHMEQQAAEQSDALVSPSEHLLTWMRDAGWHLPENAVSIPLFLDSLTVLGVELDGLPVRKVVRRPSHIVFFGRFEERKGISIFLRALASHRLKKHKFQLTFLGRPATKSADEVIQFISRVRPDLLPSLTLKTDLASDEAQAYLDCTDCIPVIPSLVDNSPCVIYESLKMGLPFIAASSGGIPELIHSSDRERCLFEPTVDSLAQKLDEVLCAESWESARPSYSSDDLAKAWLSWLERVKEQSSSAKSAPSVSQLSAVPAITVIVTHYERPTLLERCLRAFSLQTDGNFRVIVVDDGSESEAATLFLKKIERGVTGLDIQVIRQENKYLGAARNEALRHVTTPYVIFHDDDDIPFPNMVETFRKAAATSKADVVTCQVLFFHDRANGGEPEWSELTTGDVWAFPGGPVALGSVENVFGSAVSIMKREIFDDIGPYHENHGVGHEDWDLYLRAALKGKTIVSIPEPLFWYRVCPGSMLRTTARYRNMQVIASSVRSQIPANLAPLVDLAIGLSEVR